MKSRLLGKILFSLVCFLTPVLILSCNIDDLLSPTEIRESIRTIDFSCVESPNDVLRCTAVVSGGDSPITYNWQASFLSEISGVGASTVTFDYIDICNEAAKALNVTVVLNVRDGRGEEAGPISKPFSVCS